MDDHRPEREEGRNVAQQRLTNAYAALSYGEQTLARREVTSRRRDQAAHNRDVFAHRRDKSSTRRDHLAGDRDKQASDLDAKDDLADRHTLGVEALRGRGRAGRIRAARDREQAGRDREQAEVDRDRAEEDRDQAEEDRDQAGGDRDQAAYEREYAGTDDLTGARRRGVGLADLENEIRRAHREGTRLVAAYVDVDGLKSVNDEQGHAEGDALLCAVANGLRDQMRSYDLLVRLGGDEFLCALSNVTPAEARDRFDASRAKLAAAGGNSFSVGISDLRDSDSPEEFIGRADSDLLARRRGQPAARSRVLSKARWG